MVLLAPLPVSTLSSIRKFTCRGIASQQTPKRAHFRGVLINTTLRINSVLNVSTQFLLFHWTVNGELAEN